MGAAPCAEPVAGEGTSGPCCSGLAGVAMAAAAAAVALATTAWKASSPRRAATPSEALMCPAACAAVPRACAGGGGVHILEGQRLRDRLAAAQRREGAPAEP